MIAANPDAARSATLSTPSWLTSATTASGSAELVMTEIPRTRIRSWRATITSGTVDMPDGVGADLAQEAQLGARLEARAGHHDVDALVDRHAKLGPEHQRTGAQRAVVLVRHVQEAYPELWLVGIRSAGSGRPARAG